MHAGFSKLHNLSVSVEIDHIWENCVVRTDDLTIDSVNLIKVTLESNPSTIKQNNRYLVEIIAFLLWEAETPQGEPNTII